MAHINPTTRVRCRCAIVIVVLQPIPLNCSIDEARGGVDNSCRILIRRVLRSSHHSLGFKAQTPRMAAQSPFWTGYILPSLDVPSYGLGAFLVVVYFRCLTRQTLPRWIMGDLQAPMNRKGPVLGLFSLGR